MEDEAARTFFQKAQQEPENQACMDTGSANPQWASVSHGCYISLESAGVHRSLGVHISFVRSTTMDAWKPQQLKLMELGGNARLKAFFRHHGIPDSMPIKEKYNTRAAEWYRRNLKSLIEGSAAPPPLPEGTGKLPVGPVSFGGDWIAEKLASTASPENSASSTYLTDRQNLGNHLHDLVTAPEVIGGSPLTGSTSLMPPLPAHSRDGQSKAVADLWNDDDWGDWS